MPRAFQSLFPSEAKGSTVRNKAEFQSAHMATVQTFWEAVQFSLYFLQSFTEHTEHRAPYFLEDTVLGVLNTCGSALQSHGPWKSMQLTCFRQRQKTKCKNALKQCCILLQFLSYWEKKMIICFQGIARGKEKILNMDPTPFQHHAQIFFYYI